jgi:hypothetical protein
MPNLIETTLGVTDNIHNDEVLLVSLEKTLLSKTLGVF